MLKRAAGAKESAPSSRVMAGILDRVDSFLFAAPSPVSMSSASSTERCGAAGRAASRCSGSTGSIGRQAVDVIAGDPSFRVVALAAGSNARCSASRSSASSPRAAHRRQLQRRDRHRPMPGTELLGGDAALIELATRDDVDLVVVGTGGVVSLRPVLAALEPARSSRRRTRRRWSPAGTW
jgi:hypothetical protein